VLHIARVSQILQRRCSCSDMSSVQIFSTEG